MSKAHFAVRGIRHAAAAIGVLILSTLAGLHTAAAQHNNGPVFDINPILRDLQRQNTPPPRDRGRLDDCPRGMIYNPRAGRCVEPPPRVDSDDCPRGMVYSNRQRRCVDRPQRVVCEFPTERRGNRCVCVDGYHLRNGICRRDVVDELPPRRDPPPPRRDTPADPGVDVARVQACLNTLGYDAGPVDGASGRRTLNAYRAFQTDNDLAARPNRLADRQTLDRLFDLCSRPADVAAPDEPPAISPVADNRCLAPDLYDMLKGAYGERPALRPCANACLPKPAFLTEAQLADYSAREGVDWCETCIQLGAWLPLTAVLEIERAANVTLCAAPPLACFLPGGTTVRTQREVRTIFQALPISVGNEGDIAVIVGNEDYGSNLPLNPNGHSDADAVAELLTGKLGYRPENIIDLRDATLADLRRVFGSDGQPGELASRLSKPEDSDIFIYVASHGLVSGPDARGYLLPVDARTDDVAGTALPLQDLYTALGTIGARTTMLVLEASFARSLVDIANPPNLPQGEVVAMPENPVPGLVVFKASDRDQQTLQDPEYGIGLFTRYLIAGLAGEADAAPIGNGDKRIDTVELFVYTADMVRMAARKSFGMEQKPLLSRIDNLTIGQLAAR